jgi:hypothetical protein
MRIKGHIHLTIPQEDSYLECSPQELAEQMSAVDILKLIELVKEPDTCTCKEPVISRPTGFCHRCNKPLPKKEECNPLPEPRGKYDNPQPSVPSEIGILNACDYGDVDITFPYMNKLRDKINEIARYLREVK